MKNKLSISIILTILLVIAENCTMANAVYTDKQYKRFSFIIPDYWDTIPRSIIDEQAKSSNTKIKYETGLYNTANKYYFEYPYVLIWIKKVPGLNKMKFADITSSLAKEFNKSASIIKIKKLSNIVFDARFDELISDTTNHSIFFNLEGDVANIGTVRGIGSAYIGSETIVMMYCYSTDIDFQKHLPDFKKIINSFSYSESYAYKYQIADKGNGKTASGWSRVIDKGIVGIIMGSFFALILVAVKIFKRKYPNNR